MKKNKIVRERSEQVGLRRAKSHIVVNGFNLLKPRKSLIFAGRNRWGDKNG